MRVKNTCAAKAVALCAALLEFALLLGGCSNRLSPDPHADAFEYDQRGSAFMAAGRWDDAIKQYQAASRLNPESWREYYGLAIAYEKKGMLDHAIAEYRQIVALNPPFKNKAEYAYWHFWLGNALNKKGEHSQARAEWKLALTLACQDRMHSPRLKEVAEQARRVLRAHPSDSIQLKSHNR